MEIGIAAMIRKFRKDARMTQEQLAEALGVTVGAIYKWENGRSLPEISLLIEMADLFGVSVDVLLNYKVRNNDRVSMVRRLQKIARQAVTADTLAEVEHALRRYPNHFEIVYASAGVYQMAGTAQQNREWTARALELLQHALLLVDQNTDEAISALSIQVEMAQLYAELNQRDRAIELLKGNNPMGINDAQIGQLLSIENRPEEAVAYLSKALIHLVVSQIQIADGYLNVYAKQKNYKAAIEVLNWILGNIRSLQYPDQTCVLNRTEAVYHVLLAEMNLRIGQKEVAADALRRAKQIAKRFDEDPNHTLVRLRFVKPEEEAVAYDSLGKSAMEGVRAILQEENDPELFALWEAMRDE